MNAEAQFLLGSCFVCKRLEATGPLKALGRPLSLAILYDLRLSSLGLAAAGGRGESVGGAGSCLAKTRGRKQTQTPQTLGVSAVDGNNDYDDGSVKGLGNLGRS